MVKHRSDLLHDKVYSIPYDGGTPSTRTIPYVLMLNLKKIIGTNLEYESKPDATSMYELKGGRYWAYWHLCTNATVEIGSPVEGDWELVQCYTEDA